jgi:4-hydroxybenzoate polyprenyltransferase
VYYTHAYLVECKLGEHNERVNWYVEKQKYLQLRQLVYIGVCIYIAFLKLDLFQLFLHASIFVKLVLLISFLLSTAYYLPTIRFISFLNSRNKGVLKSISIAWVWTFTCCFIPVWLGSNNSTILLTRTANLYFLQLFIYVLVLAILFDIKDMLKDQKEAVYTIAIRLGAQKTVQQIIAPLLILYYIIVIFWILGARISAYYLALQGILIILSYLIAHRVLKEKAIYVNILLIDGLLVIKAVLGIAFVLF